VRIGIDIDSTLHHYWEQLREVVQRRHGVDPRIDITSHRATDAHDVTEKWLEQIGLPLARALEPLLGARRAA
jgi:hypothetical protein